MTTTAECQCCRNHFRTTDDGTVRDHATIRGDRCPGSGRTAWVDVVRPWMETA